MTASPRNGRRGLFIADTMWLAIAAASSVRMPAPAARLVPQRIGQGVGYNDDADQCGRAREQQ